MVILTKEESFCWNRFYTTFHFVQNDKLQIFLMGKFIPKFSVNPSPKNCGK